MLKQPYQRIIIKSIMLVLLMLSTLFLTACQEREGIEDIKQYEIKPYITKGDQSLLLHEDPSFITDLDQEILPETITIDTKTTYQVMDGFGAALTESSAYLIASLPEEKRQALLIDLFSKTEGIGIDFIRIPMGASDFSLGTYSYNDMPIGMTDPLLENFSLERDEAYIIPILKEILLINPDIKLMGSPWSAPAWMKDNQSMHGGSLLPEYVEVYANYFLKFIQGYEAHGLPIYAVTPQNEPLHETSSYPTMHMTVQEHIALIEKIGPTIKDAGYDTLIIAYDHNWDQPMYPTMILNNEAVRDYVAGTAFHCYAGQVSSQDLVHQSHPDKGIWFTECSGGGWATHFLSNLEWNMENLFIGSINYHSKAVLLWNLALDDQDGPTNGGCSNCRGVVTIHENGSYTKNEEYYSLAHFSKFVIPGAKRVFVETNHSELIATGFINPDETIVLVIHNKSDSDQSVNLNIDGVLSAYSVPSNGTVSLVIQTFKA